MGEGCRREVVGFETLCHVRDGELAGGDGGTAAFEATVVDEVVA